MKFLCRHRSLLFILALSPFLVQCLATSQDLRAIDLRLRTINNKLISMDRNVNDLQAQTAARAQKASVDDLQKNQADTSNSLDYLKTQLLQVKGQIEENSHQFQKLQEEQNFYRDSQSNRFQGLGAGIESLRLNLDELQTRLAALEKKSQSDSATLQQVTSEVEKLRETRADEAAKAARLVEEAKATGKSEENGNGGTPKVIEPARNKKTSGEPEAKPDQEKPEKAKTAENKKATTAEEQAQKLYDNGLAAFNAKKYQEAYAAFNRYLEKHPKGSLAGNARFWLGESLYQQQDYELAILEYQKLIADSPKNAKTPAALLKQGLAFEKLKDQETAKLVYLKLQADYKDSEEAAAAGKRLEALK